MHELGLPSASAYLALLVHNDRIRPNRQLAAYEGDPGKFSQGTLPYSMRRDLFAWAKGRATQIGLGQGAYYEALIAFDTATSGRPFTILVG